VLHLDKVDRIEGLDIYRDFSDPGLYYFMPGTPRVPRDPETGLYALRLVMYRADVSRNREGGVTEDGGFFTIDVDLAIPEARIEAATTELRKRVGGEARLTSIPFLDGAVTLTLFGVRSGSDGTGDTPFVRRIGGSTKPALYGDQQVSFGASLDRDGAALLAGILAQGGSTMAIVQYDLEYAAISPAYDLQITIDNEKVVDETRMALQAGAGVKYGPATFLARAGFEQLVQNMRDSGAIEVKEVSFLPGEAGQAVASNQEQINTIIADLMGKWFRPTAAPEQQMQAMAQAMQANSGQGSRTAFDVMPRFDHGPTTKDPATATTTATNETKDPAAPVAKDPPPRVAKEPSAPVTKDPAAPVAKDPAAPVAKDPAATVAKDPATKDPVAKDAKDPAAKDTSAQAATDAQIHIGVSFDYSTLERTERIKKTYHLNRAQAVTREIHPAGQLVVDVTDRLDQYVLEVDLDHDFFKRLHVVAGTTAQWDKDGIHTIVVELRYAPDATGLYRKFGTLRLAPDHTTDSLEFTTLKDDEGRVILWYDYRVTVHFSDDVAIGDQTGEVTSTGVPGADPEGWIRATTAHLIVHPRDVTPVIPIRVASGVVRYELVDQIHVSLAYGPHRTQVVLDQQHEDARFVVRPDPEHTDAVLTTQGTVFYKDGTRIPLPIETWNERLLHINEPRDHLLRTQVIFVDPTQQILKAQVTQTYAHGGRHLQRSVELTTQGQISSWEVLLEDPQARTWSYEVVYIRANGSVEQVGPIETSETQVVLGVSVPDVLPVEVIYLGFWPNPALFAVMVEMEYLDEDNGVHWQRKAELIRQGHPGTFNWTIPLVDPTHRTWRYRVTAFRATGQEQGPWTEQTGKTLVLMPL
jgi:hypothetical protein